MNLGYFFILGNKPNKDVRRKKRVRNLGDVVDYRDKPLT